MSRLVQKSDLPALALAWFRELLKIDTSNPPGNERPACEFVASTLAEFGIESTILACDVNRPNLIATVRGEGSPLLVNSHVDVVPALHPAEWTKPPFSAAEHDGCIYGRGALDMKYKTAFDLALMVLAKQQGVKRTLKMAAVADEESGDKFGAEYLCRHHREAIDAEYVINEVGAFNVDLAGQEFFLVQAGEKSRCVITITFRGTALHASTPLHDTVLTRLSSLVLALQKFPGFSLCNTTRAFLHDVATNLPEAARGLFLALEQPSHVENALEQIKDEMLQAELRAMLFHTIAATIARAGESANVIPDQATLVLDCRLIPGTSAEQFVESLWSYAETQVPGLHRSASLSFDFAQGYELPANDPLIARALELVPQGFKSRAKAVPFLLQATSDSSNYAAIGIKPLGIAPLYFPAGFPGLSLAHAVNERVPVSSFHAGLACYLQVMGELLGIKC